jgi:acyl-CoA thioesterase-2
MSPEPSAAPAHGQEAVDELLGVLALERIEENIYRGHHPSGGLARTFGGQTAAQALVAAARTVPPDRGIHSLHSYFLRPGDPTLPTVFLVERLRDGGSFTTRRVHGIQHGKAIYSFAASFQVSEPGFEHQDEMPDVPSPETLPTFGEAFADYADRVPVSSALTSTIDLRAIDPHPFAQRDVGPRQEARHRVWMRAAGTLPDDPVVHASMLAYMSDVTLLHPVLARHGVSFSIDPVMGASLDHAIWFQRTFRADEWLLYDAMSPSAVGGRGLAMGRLFSADGRLVAGVAQEGLVRPVDPDRFATMAARHNPLRG